MTEMLVQQYQQVLLPSLRITKFTGDPLEYSTFIRSFESQIESKVNLSDVCLRYLEQYLEVEPRELIKGCLHLDELNGYLAKYRSQETAERNCQSAMTSLPFLTILRHPYNMQSMVKKLPFPLQDRCRREANRRRVSRQTIPAFVEFVVFVKSEAGIATDPVFSRDALSRVMEPVRLHDENIQPTQAAAEQRNSAKGPISDTQANEAICNVVATGTALTSVPVVPVKLKAGESEVFTYAMLDSCSTGTFIHENVVTTLGVEGADTKLVVKTVNGPVLLDTKVLSGLIVSDINGGNLIQLGKAYTKDDIAAVEEDVPVPDIARRWTHLECIQAELPPRLPGSKGGPLMGSNCPKALEPVDIVASENGGPFAFSGWAIVGPLHMGNKEHSTVSCSRVAVKEVGSNRPFDHHFMVEDKVKEIVTPQALNEMFDLDFSERPDDKKQGHSQEDKKFLKIVSEGIQPTDDGHYVIPFRFALVTYASRSSSSVLVEEKAQEEHCSKFALRRDADDAENHVGRETADVLRKNFYVDDCLRSEESEEAAVQRIKSVCSACAAGGFKLGKFFSNRREVLVTVPQEQRAQDVRTLDLTTDHLPLERSPWSAVGGGIRYARIPNYSQGQTVHTKSHLVFGPFRMKEGRKELKRYGVLFTCLSSRAVHIETANSLETNSFLNALRRFIARRGPVREIRSDRGTNIVGAEKELKKALDGIDHSIIQESPRCE
ncbi:uncharacterized protein [Montipora foliosa]|uniref:uncharacterized protein n=1 Tax=Montipora foliosa TaxID=591990 RepID=UPI0035F1344E